MDTVTFGTKNSYTDWGLILTSKDIALPKAKTKTVEVPGRDGVIDLTEVLTDDIKFDNRKLSFTFTCTSHHHGWATVLSAVTNYLHGRKVRIRMDWDAAYYYEGRCTVNKFKSDKRTSSITIDCDCDPWKKEVNSHSDPWIWDTFSFLTGVIYKTRYTVVSGTPLSVVLINGRKVSYPKFTLRSGTCTVTYNRKSWSLTVGVEKEILDIRLEEGETTVVLSGNGIVDILWQGGSL